MARSNGVYRRPAQLMTALACIAAAFVLADTVPLAAGQGQGACVGDACPAADGAGDPVQLQQQVLQLMEELDKRTAQLDEAESRVLSAEREGAMLTKHFERRAMSLQAELDEAQARLQQQLEMSAQTEERLRELQDKLGSGGGAAGGDSAQGNACDCSAQCAAADPSSARTEDLRDEVEKLFQQEQARQRRLQHDDADSADNGPKEISIHCHSKVSVNIVDLDAAQRDRNECMVLNVNGPDMTSRLVLFCDGTTRMSDDE